MGPGVRANDSDPDGDALQLEIVSQPAVGSAEIRAEGLIRYTPPPNFNGNAAVGYRVSDGHGGTATALLRITIFPVNDAPIAVADAAAGPEDTRLVVRVLANDYDADADALRPLLEYSPRTASRSSSATGRSRTSRTPASSASTRSRTASSTAPPGRTSSP